MLGIEELLELEEDLREEFDERLEEILTKLNRTGKLQEFLELLDMGNLLREPDSPVANRSGKIIVIGKCEVGREKLEMVANKLGLDKRRFEFHLNYEDAKTFNFRKTQWSSEYSAILVGQMPHSGKDKGDYAGVISALERQDGYPPIIRLGRNGLKITKESFQYALRSLIQENKIA